MRCKVGDIAFITRADNDPGCLGKIVTVVAPWIAQGALAWHVSPPHYWHDEAGRAFEVLWDDRDLTPIRGEFPADKNSARTTTQEPS